MVLVQKELKNAYIGEIQREPWASTIAYFPLETNWTDTVWWYSIWQSGSFTTYGWVKCLYLNSQRCSWASSFHAFSSSEDFTINCWVFNSWGGSYHIYCIWDGWASYFSFIDFYYSGSDRNLQYQSPWIYPWTFGNSTATSARWHNVAAVRSSWTVKWYIDGVEYSIWVDTSSISSSNSRLSLWGLYWNNNNKLVWYLSKFIVDWVAWSSTEISRYYNQTKWNYWIS